ncbi:MAG: glycosyl transferase-like UDP-glucuronosyltransferase, partial [Variovorax sp.]
MARILLGWELGGGNGHHVKLNTIAARLAEQGHHVVFATQHLNGWPAGAEIWQAPLWPAQVTTLARAAATAPATLGDIFVNLGFGEAGVADVVLAAWDRLLAAIRPDAVASEFAPGLTLAAFGRVPVLALGTGFTLPPADMSAFPSLSGQPPAHPEAPLLDTLNRALTRIGRPGREALPAMLLADAALSSVFAELDPYAAIRRGGHGAPMATRVDDPSGPRDEIFVYMNGPQPRPAGFWQGLAMCGRPVRVYDPRLSRGDRAKLEAAGLTVETRPTAFTRIAQRSRFVLSHCGLGFTCSALAAGLPHVVAPYDLEKQLIAHALEQHGLGVRVAAASYDAEAFAALLARVDTDEALFARVTAAATGFAAATRTPR